jgi:RNA polymerase sigma factor (sigma-70 family)
MDDLEHLLDRVRAGDREATEEFVRRYQDHIRRIARIRLTDPRMTRLVESMDICQSVLMKLIRRLSRPDLPPLDADGLRGFINQTTRNHFEDIRRGLKASGLDLIAGEVDLDALPGSRGTPDAAEQTANREQATLAYARLDDKEKQLVDLVLAHSYKWKVIGRMTGMRPDAVRMAYARLVNRYKDQK